MKKAGTEPAVRLKGKFEMTLKLLSMALATTALVATGGLAVAQDKSGENVTKETPAEDGAVADAAVAHKLYAWGVENESAVAVATAAQMLASVEMKDTEREVAQAATEGADTAETGEGVDAPVTADDMLAKA